MIVRRFFLALLLLSACTSAPKSPRPASGNPDPAPPFSETVSVVGEQYVTYDSTSHDSAIWNIQPSGNAETLMRWNEPGRVVWQRRLGTTVDFVIDFNTPALHRVTLLRARCESAACRTTAQDRAFRPGTTIAFAVDGSSLLSDDESFTVYPTVTDLMRDTGTRTIRSGARHPGELAAQSFKTTLVMTNPAALTGEIIEGVRHGNFTLTMPVQAAPVSIALNGAFQLLAGTGTQNELWDCPADVFKQAAPCKVYSAPAHFTPAQPATIQDTDCGLVIAGGQQTWLLRKNAQTEELFQAEGVADCTNEDVTVYNNRKVEIVPALQRPVRVRSEMAEMNLSW